MAEGRGGKVLLGFVLLHVLCCGLPLLLAAGAFGGTGALLGSPLLLAAGAVAVMAAVALAVRQVRGRRDDACCTPTGAAQQRGASRLPEHR
jgi:hypothetical protein